MEVQLVRSWEGNGITCVRYDISVLNAEKTIQESRHTSYIEER